MELLSWKTIVTMDTVSFWLSSTQNINRYNQHKWSFWESSVVLEEGNGVLRPQCLRSITPYSMYLFTSLEVLYAINTLHLIVPQSPSSIDQVLPWPLALLAHCSWPSFWRCFSLDFGKLREEYHAHPVFLLSCFPRPLFLCRLLKESDLGTLLP